MGIKPISEALRFAQEAGLDLVEVANQADPPVCRVMDYGKFKYEQSQKAKESVSYTHLTLPPIYSV